MPVVGGEGGGVILFFPIGHSVPGIPGGRLEWDFYLSPLKPLKMLRRRVREIPILFPSHHTTPDSPFPRGRDSHMLFPALPFFPLRSSFKKPFEYTATYGAFFFSSFWQYKHKHFFPFLCQSITFALPPPPPPPGGPNCYWLT